MIDNIISMINNVNYYFRLVYNIYLFFSFNLVFSFIHFANAYGHLQNIWKMFIKGIDKMTIERYNIYEKYFSEVFYE